MRPRRWAAEVKSHRKQSGFIWTRFNEAAAVGRGSEMIGRPTND